VSAEDVWSDDTPQSPRDSRLASGEFPASFEMRVWAERPRSIAGFDIGADVFLFADPSHAHRFFEEATSTYCHRHGIALPASLPPRARNLIWDNPDGATQEDVFLLRGSQVYRVAAVLPDSGHPAAMKRTGIATVNRLACRMAEAGCPTPASLRSRVRPPSAACSARARFRCVPAGAYRRTSATAALTHAVISLTL
jgi:hypothetical protein